MKGVLLLGGAKTNPTRRTWFCERDETAQKSVIIVVKSKMNGKTGTPRMHTFDQPNFTMVLANCQSTTHAHLVEVRDPNCTVVVDPVLLQNALCTFNSSVAKPLVTETTGERSTEAAAWRRLKFDQKSFTEAARFWSAMPMVATKACVFVEQTISSCMMKNPRALAERHRN